VWLFSELCTYRRVPAAGLVLLVTVAPAWAAEMSPERLTAQSQSEMTLVKTNRTSFTVKTADGSLHKIPVSSVVAYRQRNGKTELRLIDGTGLVVATEAGNAPDTEWVFMRRKPVAISPAQQYPMKAPSSQTQGDVARKYRTFAADLQELIDKARPAIETSSEASDVRAVTFHLRQLRRAIETGQRGDTVDRKIEQMRASLERVRIIADAARCRVAKRERRIAERERKIDWLRTEISTLSNLEILGPPYGPNGQGYARSLHIAQQLQARKQQLERELHALEREAKREAKAYQDLQRQASL
jgi:hypothetical protein